MPKINLPELDALAEYLSGKVPRLGMFSTLKGLIDNSPREVMTAQEWAGYLKPGQVAMRQGVEFPLKKEELDYSQIPKFLSGFKPNEKLTRDQILGQYMVEAPNLNVNLRSHDAYQGRTREQEALRQMGQEGTENRVRGDEPIHQQYSHAERGDSPDNSASPWKDRHYQVDVTTSPDFGAFDSHFTPEDISWSRTNRLPLWGEDVSDHPVLGAGAKTMRVIDEIQSDRHQKAIRQGTWNPTTEQLNRMQELTNDMMQRPAHTPAGGVHLSPEGEALGPWGRNDLLEWLRYGAGDNDTIVHDPRWQELAQLREAAKGKVGYLTPEMSARREQLEKSPEMQDPEGYASRNRQIYFNSTGNPESRVDPGVSMRIQQMREELQRLNRRVPDTPFKTTQGFVGLEMRKALADALHTGDQALGLATGNDQNAFYERGFNPDQTQGQNYNYNVSYPAVLKDLARRMGLGYKPVDVTLATQAPKPDVRFWPPRAMRNQGVRGVDPGPHWLQEFHESVADPSENAPHDTAGYITELWDELYRNLPESDRARLGWDFTPGQAKMPDFATAFTNAQQDMRTYAEEMSKVNQKIDYSSYKNYRDRDIAERQLKGSRGYQNSLYNFGQASNEAIEAMQPLWEAYTQRFGPKELDPNDMLRKKTFENAIDLSDPEATARAKAAGVPVWKEGGNVDFDHVGHAKMRLGFAGGGKVDIVEHIVQLISEYMNHLHDVNRLPPEQLTEAHVAKAQDLAGKLQDQGINPQALVDQVMHQSGSEGATLHAEGGEVKPDDSSLTWISQKLGETPIVGEDLKRIGTRAAQQAYGLDKHGNVVAGGRAWTEKQGGTPMSLLDEAFAAPGTIAKLVNTLKGAAYHKMLSGMSEEGDVDPTVEHIISGLTDLPEPQWSKDAAERLSMLNERIAQNTGVGEPHGPRQNIEDLAGNLITPVPMAGPLKEATAARRALEFFMPVRPPLRRLPADASILGGIKTAADALMASKRPGSGPTGGGGDGGDNVLEEEAINRDNEELARRPGPGGPGEVEDPDVDVQQTIGEPAYQRYLAEMRARHGASGTGGMADGGWATTRDRLHTLQHPTIQGKPGPMPPPAELSHQEDELGSVSMKDWDLLRHYGAPEEELERLANKFGQTSMADGGQPPPEGQGLKEDDILNDLLQRRLFLRQSAPPVPTPPPLTGQAEGGKIGFAERIAALIAKLTENPGMAEHAANIQNRNWAAQAKPEDIFSKVAGTSPEMAQHAQDIQNRNWTSIYTDPTTIGPVKTEAEGGSIEPANKLHNPMWTDIRRRLEILRNPTIEGRPSGVVPPMPARTSGDPQEEMKRRIQNLMGSQMAEESGVGTEPLGPMHFSSEDTELLNALRAKILANPGKTPNQMGISDKEMSKAEDTSDETMRRGGHAKHKSRTSKVHGSMRARG